MHTVEPENMNHPLRCRCGTLTGFVSHTSEASRAVCYCKDCQAFAHYLGKTGDILDELGGTEVVATLPKYVTFTQGIDSLACMSLSGSGLLRWYAKCCNTPVGNTSRNHKLPHVGLIHTCLRSGPASPESSFGPIRMRVGTKGAKGPVRARPLETFVAIARFLKSQVRARMNGSYRQTPFFFAATGKPIATPVELSAAERAELTKSL